jgi:hypothetical protein
MKNMRLMIDENLGLELSSDNLRYYPYLSSVSDDECFIMRRKFDGISEEDYAIYANFECWDEHKTLREAQAALLDIRKKEADVFYLLTDEHDCGGGPVEIKIPIEHLAEVRKFLFIDYAFSFLCTYKHATENPEKIEIDTINALIFPIWRDNQENKKEPAIPTN